MTEGAKMEATHSCSCVRSGRANTEPKNRRMRCQLLDVGGLIPASFIVPTSGAPGYIRLAIVLG